MQTIETAAEELVLEWLREDAYGERVMQRIRDVAQEILDDATRALNGCREELVAEQQKTVGIAEAARNETLRLEWDDFVDRTIGEVIEALRTKHTRAVCRMAVDIFLPPEPRLRERAEQSPYFAECKTEVFRSGDTPESMMNPAGEAMRLISEAFVRIAWSCIREARP